LGGRVDLERIFAIQQGYLLLGEPKGHQLQALIGTTLFEKL
jgi:hypothetical protein